MTCQAFEFIAICDSNRQNGQMLYKVVDVDPRYPEQTTYAEFDIFHKNAYEEL